MNKISPDQKGSKQKRMPYEAVLFDARTSPVVLAMNYNEKRSRKYSKRYRIVSKETGEVLDDAQGWGYTSAENAYKCYGFPNSENGEHFMKDGRENCVKKWITDNLGFMKAMDEVSLKIDLGVYGPNAVFNEAVVKDMLKNFGLEPNFTAEELFKYWISI